MRWIVVPFVALALTGCATNQYRNAIRPNAEGILTKYFYAYGNYCGPDWPDTSKDITRAEGLLRVWPPTDDVDAACYAHDFCYTLAGDNDASCDSAIGDTMTSMQTPLSNSSMACWNLAIELNLAFFVKFWSVGRTNSETWSDRSVQLLLGGPFVGVGYVVTHPVRLAAGYPETQTTCNVGKSSDPNQVIAQFNDAYSRAVFNRDRKKLDIPAGPGSTTLPAGQ